MIASRAYSESRVRDRGLPILQVCGEPKFVPSTANCTVPPLSKVPEPGVTVAVKVTVRRKPPDRPGRHGRGRGPGDVLCQRTAAVVAGGVDRVAAIGWVIGVRRYSESRVRDRGLPIARVCGEPKFVPSTANCTVPPLSKVLSRASPWPSEVYRLAGNRRIGRGRHGRARAHRAHCA